MAILVVAIKIMHLSEALDHEDAEQDGMSIEYREDRSMFEPEFDWRLWCKKRLEHFSETQPPGLAVSLSVGFVSSGNFIKHALFSTTLD